MPQLDFSIAFTSFFYLFSFFIIFYIFSTFFLLPRIFKFIFVGRFFLKSILNKYKELKIKNSRAKAILSLESKKVIHILKLF